jgi:hypothetical protein
MAKLSEEEAAKVYKEGIDQAVIERNIELLVGLISKPRLPQETRDYLANVIEGLLSKRISFPNRKPKQDLEEKRLELVARALEVKKEKGWKLRAVIDFVAEEMRCAPSTAWAAWRDFGPALVAADHLRERYDIDALAHTIMTAAREGRRRLSDEELSSLTSFTQESLEVQDRLRRKAVRTGRSK